MDESPCFCLLCAPTEWGGPVWEERDSRIAESVTGFGWHVMGVAGGDAPGDWGYSIGLWHTLRSPEVSVFGLPSQTAMQVANAAGAAIREGNPLEPDQRRGDVLDGHDVAVRPVHGSWYHDFFGAGVDFYQTPPLPITQLFWPDKAGRFPWDDGLKRALPHEPTTALGAQRGDHRPLVGVHVRPAQRLRPPAVVRRTGPADSSAP